MLLPYNKKILHPHNHNLACTPIIFIILAIQVTMPNGDVSQDALLKFKQSLSNSTALLSWDGLTTPCSGTKNNWVGLICSKDGNVYGLKLERMDLSGRINIDVLSVMPELRSISFMNNKLDGPMPLVKNLKVLKSIYLSNNMFEGKIDPETLIGLNSLRKLHLANNKFTGQIPISLTKLPELTELRLEGNQFHGQIPDFKLTSFTDLSLANNQLEGPIPISLSRMSPDAFAGMYVEVNCNQSLHGNKGLCGMPLHSCQIGINLAVEEHGQDQNYDLMKFFMIFIVAAIVLLLMLSMFMMTVKKRGAMHKPRVRAQAIDLAPKEVAPTENVGRATKGGDAGKLCFVREDGERFDLSDLLSASAEILGSGSFGSSYKASLVSGSMVVVKRFKQMNNVGKEDFHEHMRRIGRLQHKNVVSLVAYYYRKGEKLLVSNFVHKGSLAVYLHGNHTRSQPALDWAIRLNIIKGVARGLAYVHKELSLLIAPHGHLKSANILMDESFNPLIHDYGLIPLINQESAQQLMVAYKSPEYITGGRINKKTDVWSLGILIVEIMTGRFPTGYLQQGSKVNLSSWVNDVVGDDHDHSKVFDNNMGVSIVNCEGEMHKMLNIGLCCCENVVEKRWDIKEACKRIEEVKERDNDNDFRVTIT